MLTLKHATLLALIAACCQLVLSIGGTIYNIMRFGVGFAMFQAIGLILALGPILFYWALYSNQNRKE